MAKSIYKLIVILCFLLFLVFIGDLLISVGLALVIYFFFTFVYNLGKQIPVLELIVLLALFQWVLGPYFDYITPATHFKYFMYVPSEVYFPIIIPGLIAFVAPVIFLKSSIDLGQLDMRIRLITGDNTKLPWTLIIIGFIAEFIFPFVPTSLLFVFFILSQFKFIGLIYMFFSEIKYDKYLMYFIFALTVISSVRSGFFHDLLLWSALFLTFIVYKYKWSTSRKVLLIFIGILFSIVTQSIKADYREIIYEDPNQASLALFGTLAYNNIVKGELFGSDESINELNVRLNQGWIISAIIENMPSREPFVDGETVEDAVSASILPRFLYENKKEAGGRENFMRFTGLQLRESTSMGTSIIGEAYANYGPVGMIIFMLLWSFALVQIYNLVVKVSSTYPSIILWLPLIFLQALKAETELVVVLNHIVKSCILIFAFFWFVTKTLKWKL